MSAAAIGILLCASTPIAAAAAVDSEDALAAGVPRYGYLRDPHGGDSVPAQRIVNLAQIRDRTDDTHASFYGEAPGLTASAPACLPVQVPPLATQYPSVAGSTLGLSAPVDGTTSDLLTRLHYAFGGGIGLSGDRARQGEREVLLSNSDALLRGSIRLTPGKGWSVFMYADVGAADSVLKWQGLAGIRRSNGLDLLGGWRHVTYHFSPGRGFDSLDFDGPFLGATFAW
jgi:hypothetical protein